MLGLSILSNLFDSVLQTKFINKIYHSVMIKETDKGERKPVALVNGRFEYVGVDDTKGFTAYCRNTGPIEFISDINLGGCNNKLFTTHIPHRMVFFNQSEARNHEDILSGLVKSFMQAGKFIKIVRVLTIPEQILQTEVPTAKLTFKDKTFYYAIDFVVVLRMQKDTCNSQIRCKGIPNPFTINSLAQLQADPLYLAESKKEYLN